MKSTFILPLLALSLNAAAAQNLGLPSCNLPEQRAVAGELGGQLTDPRQAHLSVRANVLVADISTARKARRLSEGQARRLAERVEKVRSSSDHFVAQQGFLSAAENASFDRELDAVAAQVCR